MVRQLKLPRKFGVGPQKRLRLLGKLATSLFCHERIKTTLAKAKELQPFVENIIVDCRKGNTKRFSKFAPSPPPCHIDGSLDKGPNGNLNGNPSKTVLTQEIIKKRYDDIFGVGNYLTAGDDGMGGLGYTRLWRAGRRAGDQSPIGILELVSSLDMKEAFNKFSTASEHPMATTKAATEQTMIPFKQPLRLLLGDNPKTMEGKRLDAKLKQDLKRYNDIAKAVNNYSPPPKSLKMSFQRMHASLV